MERSQYSSFEEFLEISKSHQESMELDKINIAEISEIAKAFIVNPEKYAKHLDAIYSLKVIVNMYTAYETFTKSLYGRIFGVIIGNNIKNRLKPAYREYVNNLEKLREGFKDLVPCELKIDIPQSKILDTPPEWLQDNKIIHLIEIRVAVNPEYELMPNNVILNFSALSNEIQFIDLFPISDFEKTGESEVGITTEGKFVNKSVDKTNAGLNLKGQGISLSAANERTKETENTSSEKFSYNLKYTNSMVRIQSYAVGQSAEWKIFRSNNGIPIGGMSFFLNMLAPKQLTSIGYEITLTAELKKFGETKLTQSDFIKLSRPTVPVSNILI